MRDFWHAYRRNIPAVVGLAIIVSVAVMALIGPSISPHNPSQVAVGPSLEPPSPAFPMGTDDLGRDIFSGVLSGIGVSLTVGLAATATSSIIGLMLGGIAGYYPKTDIVTVKIVEIFQVIPLFFLALVVVAVFGPSVPNVILVIGLLSWPPIAKIVRAEILLLRESDFVAAAKVCGYSNTRILFSEIHPNVLPPLIVASTLQIGVAMLTESTLSFFGFVDPRRMSLGYMIALANRLLTVAWWPAVFPGGILVALILSVNLIGNGLNEVFNPRLRQI